MCLFFYRQYEFCAFESQYIGWQYVSLNNINSCIYNNNIYFCIEINTLSPIDVLYTHRMKRYIQHLRCDFIGVICFNLLQLTQ